MTLKMAGTLHPPAEKTLSKYTTKYAAGEGDEVVDAFSDAFA
jgi:hypothetical protein